MMDNVRITQILGDGERAVYESRTTVWLEKINCIKTFDLKGPRYRLNLDAVEIEVPGSIMVVLLYSIASTLERPQALALIGQLEREFR